MAVETRRRLSFRECEALRNREVEAFGLAKRKRPSSEGRVFMASFRLKKRGEIFTIKHTTVGNEITLQCGIIKGFKVIPGEEREIEGVGTVDGQPAISYYLYTSKYNVEDDGLLSIDAENTKVQLITADARTNEFIYEPKEITGKWKERATNFLNTTIDRAINWEIRRTDNITDFFPPVTTS